LTAEERKARQTEAAGASNASLVNIIMDHMDIDRERELKKVRPGFI